MQKWVKSIGLVGLLSLAVFWFVDWRRHVSIMDAKCNALNVNKIKIDVLDFYLKRQTGRVGIIGEEGELRGYPVIKYNDVSEYLDLYPDCCRYYPSDDHYKGLSHSERYQNGWCGFAEVTIHTRYMKNNSINVTSGGHGWIVDNSYNFHSDPKER
ncbi:hypothetical protein [Roseibium alexandrii]|uniref:hypothetical protein n=1 Tax=Roseibium alexandrii TaxID=388408 RepID=UPI0037501E1C